MKANLAGAIKNLIPKENQWFFEEMLDNAKEMLSRFKDGDVSGVEEFCDLYCIEPEDKKE